MKRKVHSPRPGTKQWYEVVLGDYWKDMDSACEVDRDLVRSISNRFPIHTVCQGYKRSMRGEYVHSPFKSFDWDVNPFAKRYSSKWERRVNKHRVLTEQLDDAFGTDD